MLSQMITSCRPQRACSRLLEVSARGWGISRRLEAPTGIGMEAQKAAYEATDAGPILGMDITGSFMLSPVKSTLPDLSAEGKTARNTIWIITARGVPPNKDCKNEACGPDQAGGKDKRGTPYPNKQRRKDRAGNSQGSRGIYVPAVCAGRGSRGKCRIRVAEGEAAVTPSDERIFTPQQLSQGIPSGLYLLSDRRYDGGNRGRSREENGYNRHDIPQENGWNGS